MYALIWLLEASVFFFFDRYVLLPITEAWVRGAALYLVMALTGVAMGLLFAVADFGSLFLLPFLFLSNERRASGATAKVAEEAMKAGRDWEAAIADHHRGARQWPSRLHILLACGLGAVMTAAIGSADGRASRSVWELLLS